MPENWHKKVREEDTIKKIQVLYVTDEKGMR